MKPLIKLQAMLLPRDTWVGTVTQVYAKTAKVRLPSGEKILQLKVDVAIGDTVHVQGDFVVSKRNVEAAPTYFV